MNLGTRPSIICFLSLAVSLTLCVMLCSSAVAQIEGNPIGLAGLAERIDAILDDDPDWMMGEKLPDGLLLRRLSLDLRNVVPTQEEIEAFLTDSAENRWTRWIDRFQRDPLAAERLVDWYDKTLMQRRPFQHTDRATWLQMLRQAVDERKGADVLMRSIVTSAWWNRSQRAEQRFFLDRGGDPHAIARDIGRILFGRDMQCAQCHDHPQIDDYLQIDYHGLLAFVSASTMAEGTTKDDKGADQKVQLYIERAAGDATFESVFDKGIKFRTATRVPGHTEHMEPYLAPDQRYQPQSKPDTFSGIGAPPVASRREILASHLNVGNRSFAENWANRLWALMFGRGIVHPLDMHHSDNPPSNPRLLAAITDAFIASQFDVPAVLAELARSRAYQRGYRIPIESFVDEQSVVIAPPEKSAVWLEFLKSRASEAKAEQARLVELQDAKQAAMEQARSAWRSIQQERTALRAELDAAEAGFNESQKKVAEGQKGLDQAVAAEQAASAKIALLEEAAQKLEQAKSGPEDSELNPAIAAAQTRAEQMKAALPAQQQAVATATANRDAAVAAREGERGKWQAVVDKLTPVEQRLTEADRSMVQARREHEASRADANAQLRRVAQSERLQRWLERSTAIAAKRSQRLQLEQQAAEGVSVLATYQSQVDDAQKIVDAAQTLLKQHDERVATVASEVAAIEAQMTQLQTAKKALADSATLVSDSAAFAAASAELDRSSESRMTKLTEIKATIAGMTEQRIAMASDVDSATAVRDLAKTKWNEFDTQAKNVLAQRDQLSADLESQFKQCSEIRMAVSADRQTQHALAAERPLSPEQLAWSILRSTHVLSSYVANEHAELNKQGELPADATEQQRAEREKRAVRGAIDKLRGNVDTFSNLYSSGVGQTSDEFFASPDQALYIANGGAVHSWAAPNGSNISSRVLQSTDPQQAAKLLYVALLSREPSPAEQQFIAEQLTNAGDQKPSVVQELVWSILAGAEYRMYP
ncbi:MAG: DUF1549 domain-containing protein [Planctomycetota bacterium]